MAVKTFTVPDLKDFREKLSSYLRSHSIFSVLDSNGYAHAGKAAEIPFYYEYDLLAGIGAVDIFIANAGTVFRDLSAWKEKIPGWIFGYFGYDLKNELEKLDSAHTGHTGLPDSVFFRPLIRLALKGTTLELEADDPETVWQTISKIEKDNEGTHDKHPVFTPRMSALDYTGAVNAVKELIIEGDVYELNLCQEFYAENTRIDPFTLYRRVSAVSPQPFSAFMRLDDKYVVCASMERFLKKKGDQLIAQPIKGTVKRGASQAEDALLAAALGSDEKERAENIMIVDLVRNDLSRSSVPGTVEVKELCCVYAFPYVHQMISTVDSTLLENLPLLHPIKNAFPMGSMTGAPKIAAMQFIDKFEKSRRGIYSGAIGYFTPEDDFDFNVVIRTFVYDQASGYLSIHAGSAITYDSDAEKEYAECCLKISGLLEAIGGKVGLPK